MAVYYSFHYDRDVSRVQLIRNMGVVDGQPLLNAQDWESVRKRGDQAIKDWIEEQMKWKSAVVVLIGAETASRPWVKYEIVKAWNDKKKLVGVRIHGLKDLSGHTDSPGTNPFDVIKAGDYSLTSCGVPTFNPSGSDSQAVYASIKSSLNAWVERAYARS